MYYKRDVDFIQRAEKIINEYYEREYINKRKITLSKGKIFLFGSGLGIVAFVFSLLL